MIRNTIFHRYFFIAVSMLLLFVVLGFGFSTFLFRQMLPQQFPNMEISPPIFMARVIDRMNSKDRAQAIQELLSWQQGMKPVLKLIDKDGRVIYPPHEDLPFDWARLEKPTGDYDYKFAGVRFAGPPMPPPDLDFMHGMGPPPPTPGGPHGGLESVVIKMPGSPEQFLYMEPPRMEMPPGPTRSKFPIPLIGVLSQFISLLLGVIATLAIIYWSIRNKVKQADDVISELQNGNLKARFKITRHDEFGQAMQRFNKMAEEIEKLVEHMREVESARNKLIQELAHDLRTPIASLGSLLETLSLRRQNLTEEVQSELLMLSLKEVDYFSRLVEDLLFLAQVNEPKYRGLVENVDLLALLQDESYSISTKHAESKKKITISETACFFQGDRHLLQRLFRNALDNSYSFANSTVQVDLNVAERGIKIMIDDDGDGFTAQGMQTFGEKKFSRHLKVSGEGRVSVGLGSVIMKTICEIYKGSVQVSNRTDQNGLIVGARVIIILPLGQPSIVVPQ